MIQQVKLNTNNATIWENRIANDDPVTIKSKALDSVYWRSFGNRKVWYIGSEERPDAIVCVAFTRVLPEYYQDLLDSGDILTCYTLWSYRKGAGTDLIEAVRNHVLENHKTVTRLVTMSPKTEMARNFHFKNGAFMARENKLTINYEYPLIKISECV